MGDDVEIKGSKNIPSLPRDTGLGLQVLDFGASHFKGCHLDEVVSVAGMMVGFAGQAPFAASK